MLSSMKLKDSANNYRLFAIKVGSFHCSLQSHGTGPKSDYLGRPDRITHTALVRNVLLDCSFKPQHLIVMI